MFLVCWKQFKNHRNSKTSLTLCHNHFHCISSGTTWLTQIVSLLMAGEEKYEAVSNIPVHDRTVFMEQERPGLKPAIEKMKDMAPPRLAKTHLSYDFVNRWVERDRVKTIVTLRNPKDTLVSLYHFYQLNKRNYIFISLGIKILM